MSKTVLITGISGFIAGHTAIAFLDAGYAVRGTMRDAARADGVRNRLSEHSDTTKLEFAAADLDEDAGWSEAVDGCQCVVHMASPFPLRTPRDANELIRPAVDGTLRVMTAAARSGARRFVQTSSTAAVLYGNDDRADGAYTEADWTNADNATVSPYQRSKTLAERAARQFMEREKPDFHFSSVNPGTVYGPLLGADVRTSAELILMLLKGKYPGVPRMHMPTVDVRDVARMHLLATETTQPSGGRYLAVGECLWLIETARVLRAGLGRDARKVPKRELPDWFVRTLALFDPAAREAATMLGRKKTIDNSRTREALGFDKFISSPDAIVATARSLIGMKLV